MKSIFCDLLRYYYMLTWELGSTCPVVCLGIPSKRQLDWFIGQFYSPALNWLSIMNIGFSDMKVGFTWLLTGLVFLICANRPMNSSWDSKSYDCKATDIFVYVCWYFFALTNSYFVHSVVLGILWWTQILLALNMFMFVSSNYCHDFGNYLHAFAGS